MQAYEPEPAAREQCRLGVAAAVTVRLGETRYLEINRPADLDWYMSSNVGLSFDRNGLAGRTALQTCVTLPRPGKTRCKVEYRCLHNHVCLKASAMLHTDRAANMATRCEEVLKAPYDARTTKSRLEEPGREKQLEHDVTQFLRRCRADFTWAFLSRSCWRST